MLMGATGRAGNRVADGDLEIEDAVDLCVQIALGGLERLAAQARARA
nr:hypothetical protein JKL49_12130 [Phenylobacterium glaciei]